MKIFDFLGKLLFAAVVSTIAYVGCLILIYVFGGLISGIPIILIGVFYPDFQLSSEIFKIPLIISLIAPINTFYCAMFDKDNWFNAACLCQDEREDIPPKI